MPYEVSVVTAEQFAALAATVASAWSMPPRRSASPSALRATTTWGPAAYSRIRRTSAAAAPSPHSAARAVR
ncbi:hypothetical protein [Streptomyces hundungensis]|uniref:hypothetical protein n=1 Tax=Streptomyces hundungensis TaxID=1077946 RepID=UPI001FEC6785|nr:hypothetical protein [Streptomyces hundungensis]